MFTFIKSKWYEYGCYITFFYLRGPKYIMIKHLRERMCEIFKNTKELILRAEKTKGSRLTHYN